ncbi:hypothetical protein [Massilia antarctica]|uniref:hypothetical protein n=1 Tax=Massilia antarctica TaxID=2765360 RepID=UPI0006BB759E|nr:hypothetical protein [Massilia sp. H27-R4]MCY0911705.1 hypothetical protein [Massilia sp. H27-R4]CUI06845.1 hypothetical protein BN2497_8467 [Janthinobacterium sp. CG23_2]CUU30631.1 hypothetical protein BN3177_8467 [Janthinobacterium sp. CG23_2]
MENDGDTSNQEAAKRVVRRFLEGWHRAKGNVDALDDAFEEIEAETTAILRANLKRDVRACFGFLPETAAQRIDHAGRKELDAWAERDNDAATLRALFG